LENWKIGKLENWKIGKLENWKIGKLENWKIGKLENWKIGKLLFSSLYRIYAFEHTVSASPEGGYKLT
jgi:hypothetical protein